MWDRWWIEEGLRRLFEAPTRREQELLAFLAEERASDAAPSLRRRIAGVMVRLGLKLDPDAAAFMRGPGLREALSVRD